MIGGILARNNEKPAGWAGFFGLYFYFTGSGEIVGQEKAGNREQGVSPAVFGDPVTQVTGPFCFRSAKGQSGAPSDRR